MDMNSFAREIVLAADKGLVTLLPVPVRDFNARCIMRFKLGTLYTKKPS